MTVSKQDFDSFTDRFMSEFEKFRSDMRTEFNMVVQYVHRLDENLEERFKSVDKRFDRLELSVEQLGEDVNAMRSSFGDRFDVLSGQLRIVDQGHFRIEDRLAKLEKRVKVLEEKAS